MIQFKELEGFHFVEVFPKLNKQRGKGKRILGKEFGTFALMNEFRYSRLNKDSTSSLQEKEIE